MTARAPKPFWALRDGSVVDGLPTANDLRIAGGRAMFGRFFVYCSGLEGRQGVPWGPWVVGERRGIGTVRPSDDWHELNGHSRYADAVKEARELARAAIVKGRKRE